jgi:hypothetical protein
MRRTDTANMPEVEPEGDNSPVKSLEFVTVDDLRTEDDTTTCLRPLGLCKLGGGVRRLLVPARPADPVKTPTN